MLPYGAFPLRVSEFAAQFVVGVSAEHEANHTTDSPEYIKAAEAYYKVHLIRQPRASKADEDSSAAAFSKLIYEYMWGPSELTSTGTLKHFDTTPWLRAIKVPTLFITGEFNEATPSSTRRFSQLVPGAEFVMIPGSGHVTHNDNLEALLAAVRSFHTRVENR